MESSNITSGLPDDNVTHPFTSLSRLNIEAQRVLERLNQSDDARNQYILALNLPQAIRSQPDENKNVLQGINFRLMFDGTIKIVPSEPHETATSRLRENISLSAALAGTSMDDILWSGKTTHRLSLAANKGKQADDLKWWFENSQGAVRTVILLSIERTRKTIRLEKWQLSPPGQSVTPAQGLRSQQMTIPPIPPLGLQQAANQPAFIAQIATITPTNATGSVPVHLHYQALFNRAPGPGQPDIRLDAASLMRVGVSFQ
ncbi:uncharacterized protein P174DRAFT_461935 [Aspergillus novofumigatus IBT 16806]|uniref:Uncharacterized protein n=1 Tax=Aspergillus novofumigatus (strain IBT 16806) TaxID=1392255 RepID=A0A2I1C181_ASPN1|nr:uncharacterized protein P174DRAFT_461935 [Aspergillus novofumigatus IBT 16806]PKX91341.1 hypothetical protein P174DRAFT_461935 [Aspergillus novofumigatus IBT 16806]